VAVLPAATVALNSSKALVSHPGASFGGLVTSLGLGLRDTTRVVDCLSGFCREAGYSAMEMVLPTQIYYSSTNRNLEFVLYRAGYRYQRRELSYVVHIPPASKGNVGGYSAEFRRQIRRAEQLGVMVEESDDLSGFYRIVQHNLASKHQARPTHSLDELLDLKQRCPGRILLMAAYVAGEMVAGMLSFVCNPRAVLAFYIGLLDEFQRYRAVNLVCHKTFCWCQEHGFEFFDFGTTTINGEPNWGLVHFREAAGGRGVFRDRVRLELEATTRDSKSD